MIDIIGYDIETVKQILDKNNIKYKIEISEPIKHYKGYQKRVIKTEFKDGTLTVIVAEF
ncbi:hypothetical protein PQ744_04295 [Thermoanaerobacterium thermosaccharolyticum]|uniref:hypothetical protein n=1 Tax=Thermoanaerobacterium thermosaccharolyticum TaxID=1517 RepID=UPI0015DFBE52|nr:hypothetical protein [Thermoanaerobacterium thermosaccharolyticum]